MKPDWCDEETWERAKEVLDGYLYSKMSPDEAIARALIAAKNDGLELAAEVADGLADAHDGAAIRAAEEVDVVENRAAESALRSFAVAIRNRMQEPR